jgi:sulfur relay (sulfurtransferase) complex TusBCD TusD component (DsrE family)
MTENNKTNYLLIINDSPYGNERPYNSLRLAMNIAKRDGTSMRVFLLGDGVQCAIKGQEIGRDVTTSSICLFLSCVAVRSLPEGLARKPEVTGMLL